MPITRFPSDALTLVTADFGGFSGDDFGDFSSPMNNANFGSFASDRMSRDYDGFTLDDFGDYSSPMNDGNYMTFASPGALSNDFGTF